MATDGSTISIKLLIDPKRKKVLFAEAEKDFVDFLFTLLTLPLGTVISLVSEKVMVGCLGKLHQSVQSLGEKYMQPKVNKNILLNPMSVGADLHHLLTDGEANEEESSKNESHKNDQFYVCVCCLNQNIPKPVTYSKKRPRQHYVANRPRTVCPECNFTMHTPATCVASPNAKKKRPAVPEGGYVKDVVTYMIMDDLEVNPMSTISGIAMLNKLNVKDVGSLKEKVVDLGVEEGLKLLKASMKSKSVLSHVFLGKKAA